MVIQYYINLKKALYSHILFKLNIFNPLAQLNNMFAHLNDQVPQAYGLAIGTRRK